MEITIVVDNVIERGRNLIAAHGFSALIEGDKTILFDTGQGREVVNNLTVLGKDISSIESVVLSHGHYDHTGGLVFLRDRISPTLYYHASFFEPQYKEGEYIGVPISLKTLLDYGWCLEEVNGILDMGGGIYLVNKIGKYNDFEVSSYFFPYEIVLVIDGAGGLVIVSGCSHRGICNIVEHVEKEFGKKVGAVVGGLHLFLSLIHI